jgi:ribonucleoside-diphosphate reductase alpha chain
VKILYDRYLLRDEAGRLLETPQYFFMRVAMGIALGENESNTEWAIKFYNCISSFDYMPSTPTYLTLVLPAPKWLVAMLPM